MPGLSMGSVLANRLRAGRWKPHMLAPGSFACKQLTSGEAHIPDSPLDALAARSGWVPTGGSTMDGVTAVACICCHMPRATCVCRITLEGGWACALRGLACW